MEADKRPTAEEILKKINHEQRGKLTVYLGAIAGSGKTYAMLSAAHERLREGIDVKIGWVETHKRQDTEQLVAGLPIIEPMIINYRGKEFAELNIDKILELKPQIVLVDELAHSNIPGARHKRRFQDVEEILAAGIDVYTTLNIQHIESLNDIVSRITETVVAETVPDAIIENADYVRLIDISPSELKQRLLDGKVYCDSQKVNLALNEFFREGNITALREMALRFTAGHVDKAMSHYMQDERIEGPWPASAKVMVGISSHPGAARLIRVAKQLSDGLHAELIAVHIATSNEILSANSKIDSQAMKNMRLAESLGARPVTMVGSDPVRLLIELIKTYNIHTLVIGETQGIKNPFRKSLSEKILKSGVEVNLYVANQGNNFAGKLPSNSQILQRVWPLSWRSFTAGAGLSLLVALFNWLARDLLGTTNVVAIFAIPVVLTALLWGRMPAFTTSMLCFLLFDICFIPPIGSFEIGDVQYIWSLVVFFILSFLVGGLSERMQVQLSMTRQRERSVRTLYEFSREMVRATTVNEICEKLCQKFQETFDLEATVLIKRGEHLAVEVGKELQLADFSVALWCWEHNKVAGNGTETLPGSTYKFWPLTFNNQVVGVLALLFANKAQNALQQTLLDSWVRLASLSISSIMTANEKG